MRMLKNRTVVLCLAVLHAGAAGIRGARAADTVELVRQVPADCWGFAAVQSLDNLDKKAALIAQKFGLPLPPLKQMLLMQLPVGQDLDSASPIVIVGMDMQKYGEKAVAIVVPAKDPKALIDK